MGCGVSLPKNMGRDSLTSSAQNSVPVAALSAPPLQRQRQQQQQQLELAEPDFCCGEISRAGEAIARADVLVLVTGAGWSKDSGLPTYQDMGPRYKQLCNAGLFCCQPKAALDSRSATRESLCCLAFWADCFDSYRRVPPHEGYGIVRSWQEEMFGREGKDFIAMTSNVDHHMARTFGDECVEEHHGTVERWQCATMGQAGCGKVWSADWSADAPGLVPSELEHARRDTENTVATQLDATCTHDDGKDERAWAVLVHVVSALNQLASDEAAGLPLDGSLCMAQDSNVSLSESSVDSMPVGSSAVALHRRALCALAKRSPAVDNDLPLWTQNLVGKRGTLYESVRWHDIAEELDAAVEAQLASQGHGQAAKAFRFSETCLFTELQMASATRETELLRRWPRCACKAGTQLARPNVKMFADTGFQSQDPNQSKYWEWVERMNSFCRSANKADKHEAANLKGASFPSVVFLEIGCGSQVRIMRNLAEMFVSRLNTASDKIGMDRPVATLIRVNPEDGKNGPRKRLAPQPSNATSAFVNINARGIVAVRAIDQQLRKL